MIWATVLLILGISGVLASPVNKRVWPMSVSINEHGAHFNESIMIDEPNDVLIFHVPSHRDIMEDTIFIDNHWKFTLHHVKGNCYLAPTTDVRSVEGTVLTMPPAKEFERIMRGEVSEELITQHEWHIQYKVNNLPNHVTDFCAGDPVYLLGKKVPRKRRDVGQCSSPSEYCALEMKSCHYFPVSDCGQMTLNEQFGVLADQDYRLIECTDQIAHFIDQVLCCTPCCENEIEADGKLPPCYDVWPDCELVAEEITFADAIDFTRKELARLKAEEENQAKPTFTEKPVFDQTHSAGIVNSDIISVTPESGNRKHLTTTEDYDEYDDHSGKPPDPE